MKSFIAFIIFAVAFIVVSRQYPQIAPFLWNQGSENGPAHEQKQTTKKAPISPARNLSGTWAGVAPQGAIYRDNVANPACEYEANLTFSLTHTGNNINGTVKFAMRKAKNFISSVPCLPLSEFTLPIAGAVAGATITFSHPGILGSFSPTNFTGTFTTDIMSGTFERAPGPTGGADLTGVKGTWIVKR